MISYLWSGKTFLWRLLLPISLLYGLVSSTVRLCYKLGWKKVWYSPVPVVIVGNLTVGGNGKTPFVIWLVKQLQKQGIRVGVVSRGYGGKSSRYPLSLNEKTLPSEAGDEPILIYQRTGAPCVVAPKRHKAVQALIEKNTIQIVISDDGLQHYALGRDIEIVVIDGIRRFGNGWWLPAGPMRERESRLRSVDTIIVNGGAIKNGEISMKLHAELAVNLLTGETCEVSKLDNLVAIAGISYPPHFFSLLKKHGAKLSLCIPLADHQILSYEQVNGFTYPGQMLIMTEKDAVKCRAFAQKNWWYLPVNAELNSDQSKYLLQYLVSLVVRKVTKS